MDYNDLIQFLNQPAIRILLHAAPVGRVIFEECNSQAKDILQEDIMQSVSNILPELLNNYPGLFYQGIFDLVDGVPATEAMLSNRVSRNLVYSPAYTIMGGTTQILRNIIGERILGLPREPRPQQ